MIDAASSCTWCNKSVPEGHEVFGLGVKAKKGLIDKLLLEAHEGEFITLELSLSRKIVTALVTNTGSQAKIDGKDLMLMTCCQSCAVSLKYTLQKEVDMFGEISMN